MKEKEGMLTRRGFLGRLIWALPVLLGIRSARGESLPRLRPASMDERGESLPRLRPASMGERVREPLREMREADYYAKHDLAG